MTPAINYVRAFIEVQHASKLFDILQSNVNWQSETYRFYGKEVVTKRKTAFFGDNGISYTYSGILKEAETWSNELFFLKNQIEAHLNTTFNSCLLNLYPTGKEGMGWHQDNEPELGPNPIIASVSLGAERMFKFRHLQTKMEHKLLLETGSLLVMEEGLQSEWQHMLPKTTKDISERINLTFRRIYME